MLIRRAAIDCHWPCRLRFVTIDADVSTGAIEVTALMDNDFSSIPPFSLDAISFAIIDCRFPRRHHF